MSVTPEVREMAAKTAAHLREAGWTQNDYSASYYPPDLPNCSKCLVGAARYVQTGDPARDPDNALAESGLFAAIYPRLPHEIRELQKYPGEGAVTMWNDEATEDEVLALLDAIANDLDESVAA